MSAHRYSPALSSKSDYSRAQVPHPFSFDAPNREPPLTPALGSIGKKNSHFCGVIFLYFYHVCARIMK